MDEVEATEPRAKRQKRDKFGRLAALEKFKNLKEKGTKNKYEVNQVENVYETVDEREYTKKVLSRQEDDWIVDDDGNGYVEDGRDIFDDDLDSESIAAASARSKDKTGKKKKKAVSANHTKSNIQFMLSNMPSKKKEDVKLDDDDVLSELINEIDENEESGPILANKQKSAVASTSSSVLSEKQASREYMKTFSLPKRPQLPPVASVANKENKINDLQKPAEKVQKAPDHVEKEKEEVLDVDESMDFQEQQDSVFDDDFDMTQVEDFEVEEVPAKAAVTEEQLLNGWETMQQGVENATQNTVIVNAADLPVVENEEGKQVFRFFWWDAFEDRNNKPGTVLLFGKTYSKTAKDYVSCCVVVKNIDRRFYLLPRTHHLSAFNKETDQPVALIDVYQEFNDVIAPRLGLKEFKSRKVSKNYAFNPDIPLQSEYLEVKYAASNPPINSEQTGKTFWKVFGANSSFLELLLLERKIKGPCWLDVTTPETVTNPMSWCKLEVNCAKSLNISVVHEKIPPPPLVVAAINMRSITSSKGLNNEIVMISCLRHSKYHVDKQAPNPPFQQHFCVFAKPKEHMLPLDFHENLSKYKATRVQKMDTERALLNYFVNQFALIDPDLIVGHDLQGYQINILSNKMVDNNIATVSRLSKLKRNKLTKEKLQRELFSGRLVCDMKISARELIKARSYDLNSLCQTILKLKEEERVDLEMEDIPKMLKTSGDLLKLISLTMQDTAYILKMLYELNVIPLALQITNIAGNVMSRTLMGGRSERNEFLLLHAFSEKDYIVPDKNSNRKHQQQQEQTTSARKKPAYSGGLVLDPKVGFYDAMILLMDFNSLYPSIIQEYNICFTTIPPSNDENTLVLPDKSLPLGILPTEIRKLVESRREVKKLMVNVDSQSDVYMQYNIRQLALKLTANSMYGCLGFSNSRFYAKNLAALVTQKGREILMNTRDLVQKQNFEVIYGDTDSIMINTNSLDYEQVFKIGSKIKQEVNKLYKQVELEIDGVFRYLLLLKKKKYAAVSITKTKSGELKMMQELKGLDIVRRDWSQLAVEAGKMVLNQILCEQSLDERISNIHAHLAKLRDDLMANKVPLSLLVITKQLTKEPHLYADKNVLPHVQVALRYNKRCGKPLRAGDVVPYVICEDGSTSAATQRAYHPDELKTNETLKIDVKYYLSQQIHSVVNRLCEPIDGTDGYELANVLGIEATGFKKGKTQTNFVGENIRKPEVRYRDAEPFEFTCMACKHVNAVKTPFENRVAFLSRCAHAQCEVRPIEYLGALQNQLVLKCRGYIERYYQYVLVCEDPGCGHETRRLPLRFVGKYPVCTLCHSGVMYKKYTEGELDAQLSFFEYLFDLSKHTEKPLMEQEVENGFHVLKETVSKFATQSAYRYVQMDELFLGTFRPRKIVHNAEIKTQELDEDDVIEQEEEEEAEF